ncbi:hypothetical protein LTR17_010232 [Elasticomyces elasticus]|nr:hypothetical protein LTR17_010232 [Elasticomyces elasticus]
MPPDMMTPSPLNTVSNAEGDSHVLVDISHTTMIMPRPEEKRSLMARFKEFMNPQERVPNVLRKRRPDKPGVKRSMSVDGDSVAKSRERFQRLSRLRESFSGNHAQAEDAVESPPHLAMAPLEGDLSISRQDSRRRKRSLWFHRPLGPSKSSRDLETGDGDQRISQTPLEGDLSATQDQSSPPATALSRTLSAPTQPNRLSVRNAFPPRRRPPTPPRVPSLSSESTLSDRDLDKWARNGDRVRNSHFIPPFPDIPAPWTAGEQNIPSVPGPLQVRLQARRQPSRGSLNDARTNRRPVSHPLPHSTSSTYDSVGLANATEPFPALSDCDFDAHRGQKNAWVESPATEETETYSSDPRYYTSPFPVPRPVSCPQPGLSDLTTATTPQRARPLSPSREASIAAGEAIAQEGEKYVPYRPPPIPVPVPSFETRMQQEHDYTAATEQRLADYSVVELDAGPDRAGIQSSTYGVVNAAGLATLNSVPGREITAQQGHKHTAAHQPPADQAVAELDAGPETTLPTSRNYGVVEFAGELRADRRRQSSEYSEDSFDREKGPAAVAGSAAGHASWQQRGAMLGSQVMPETALDPPEELLRWVERQPSVLHQLTYQRMMGSQSPLAIDQQFGSGSAHRSPLLVGRHEAGTTVMESPVVVDSSETTPHAENLVEDIGVAALPVEIERERPSSPVPVLYFTTVPPRNAYA